MTDKAISIKAASLESAADNAIRTGNFGVALDWLDQAEDLYTTGNMPVDAGRVRARIEEAEFEQDCEKRG